MVLVAVMVTLTAVAVTRTTRAHLVDQVDEQLAAAENPVRGFDFGPGGRGRGGRPGGPPGGARFDRITSLYAALVAGDGAVTTLLTPNLRGDDPAIPVIDAEQARDAAGTGRPFTV